MSKNILLMSEVMIKERTSLHGNIDPKLITPELKVAQDMYILPILGTALFDKLLNIINDNTINSDASLVSYKKLLDDYIIDALMYHSLVALPVSLSYQFWNKGVVRKNGDNTELPTMSELIDIGNMYKK